LFMRLGSLFSRQHGVFGKRMRENSLFVSFSSFSSELFLTAPPELEKSIRKSEARLISSELFLTASPEHEVNSPGRGLLLRWSPKWPTCSKESRYVLRWSPILPAWRTDSPVCRVKYPLQAGVFGLQAGNGSRIRFQVGKIGLRMQATSEERRRRLELGRSLAINADYRCSIIPKRSPPQVIKLFAMLDPNPPVMCPRAPIRPKAGIA
jgi:hypothetical protein